MSEEGKTNKKASKITEFKVGFFLASRDLRRANIWTTLLTIAVMVLTFLNLVVVSGVLVGLVEGTVYSVQERYLGDLIVSTLKNQRYIERTPALELFVKSLPEVSKYSVRYIEPGQIDGNYKEIKKPKEVRQIISVSFAGIVPSVENSLTHLSDKMVEGEFLSDDDYDEVVMGAYMFRKYLGMESESLPVLDEDVTVGSKVKITIGGYTREVRIKGIIKTKVDEIDRRVFMTANQLRVLANRYDYSANEIAIKLVPGSNPNIIKNVIASAGFDKYAKIQTAEDAEPKFVKDLRNTFAILGNIISSVGLVVAAITIFIVIFINAITRRKYIGIMKGIGISNFSIELSYVIQSVFYALIGITIGVVIVFAFLKPFFLVHPINFPFGDGILVATVSGTTIRALILLAATVVAGYIPARIVINQNTLDAILGR